jgi:adenine-specific DNA-methyltransferase
MAHIDELLTRVTDEGLREELRRAAGELRRRKKFGLVFEEHIPEIALLPGAGVQEGSTVLLRKESDDQTRYTVQAVRNGIATIRTNGSEPIEVAVSDLLVVKSLGEPVYPVLTLVETVSRAPSRPYHVVINGENFHALQLTLFGLEERVDAIYIDPPYNTGARDWKYNNHYVDGTDAWRHSKWLSFMEKRLRLAKRLLKPDGVLIVTVDENEVHHLGVLLEDLLPTALRQMVTIVINPSGASNDGLSRVEEYAFFCFLGGSRPNRTTDDYLTNEKASGKDIRWESLMRGGNAWYRASRPNLCYPVLLDPHTERIVDVGPPYSGEEDAARPTELDGKLCAWPVREDGRLGIWRVEGPTLLSLAKEGYAYVSSRNQERGTWTIRYLMSGTLADIKAGNIIKRGVAANGQALLELNTKLKTTAKTVWYRGRHTAGGAGGTYLVSSLLGAKGRFPYPKSVYAVADALEIAIGHRKDAIVVDFFAGSGTTLNAVALLNSRDDGKRQCILITNNEVSEEESCTLHEQGHFRGDPEFEAAGIFESVTRPRVKAALTGVLPDGSPVDGDYLNGRACSEGFPENAAFFRLDYADPDTLALGYAFATIVPALWLAAGGKGDPSALCGPEPRMFLPQGAPFAVLLNEDALREFLARLGERPDVTHVWLVTDSEGAFARMREQVPGNRTVGMLYRDYLRNFRINAEVVR